MDIEHVLERCEKTEENEVKWNEQMEEGRETIVRLKRIKWIRNNKRKKEKSNRYGKKNFEFENKWR